jgi:hypothetical protein
MVCCDQVLLVILKCSTTAVTSITAIAGWLRTAQQTIYDSGGAAYA